MVDLKWQRTLEGCRHPDPCQCDTNIHTSILGDSKGGSYFGALFSFTNWWRVKLNLFKIWKTCAIYELKFRGWVLLYIDRMQGVWDSRDWWGGWDDWVQGAGDHPGGNWGNHPPETSSKLEPWLWLLLRNILSSPRRRDHSTQTQLIMQKLKYQCSCGSVI